MQFLRHHNLQLTGVAYLMAGTPPQSAGADKIVTALLGIPQGITVEKLN